MTATLGAWPMSQKRRRVLLAMQWYEARVHLGVLDYAREHDLDLIADEHHVGFPRDLAPDGILLSPCNTKGLLSAAESLKAPIVLVSENGMGLDLPCVMPDYTAIGRMAADLFAERGFEHFAYFYPHADRPTWHMARMEGFEAGVAAAGGMFHSLLGTEEMARHGMSAPGGVFDGLPGAAAVYRAAATAGQATGDPSNTAILAEHRESILRAQLSWLKREVSRLPLPLAIFASDDGFARTVERACMEMGIAVPEQAAVLGVNDSPMECPYAPIPLSSIDPDWHTVGWEAAATLDAVMAGRGVLPLQLIPPKGVVERRSTSILAVDDRRVAAAVAYIWERVDRNPSVQEVCDAVGTPRRTLAYLFRKHLSRGVKQEIVRQRIRRVKELIRESDLTGSAIADRLDYRNAYYMYRMFKQQTGMTTGEYRKSWQLLA